MMVQGRDAAGLMGLNEEGGTAMIEKSEEIDFDLRKELEAARLESERIAKDPSVKGYTDLDELFFDLKEGTL